jgi:hypothetical protein
MVTGVNLPDGFVAPGGSELKESLNSKTEANYRMDAGLLILRCAGLFLALTFGRQKVGWLIELIRSHHILSSWDFARFLQGLGFPRHLCWQSAPWSMNRLLRCLFRSDSLRGFRPRARPWAWLWRSMSA